MKLTRKYGNDNEGGCFLMHIRLQLSPAELRILQQAGSVQQSYDQFGPHGEQDGITVVIDKRRK